MVLVSGASPAAYDNNGNPVVVTAVDPVNNTFSYAVTGSPGSPASGTITVQPYGLSPNGTTAIAWLPNHGYSNGDWIDITGATSSVYNGLHQIGNVTPNTFTYTVSSTPPSKATGNIVANKIVPISGTYLAPWVANVDLNPPGTPANLRAAITGNNTQVALSWTPVADLTSGIAYYQIYRDGAAYAQSTTAAYTDTSGISSLTPHAYQVAAVNYDGVMGGVSSTLTVGPPGIAAVGTGDANTVWVTFSEPVTAASAQSIANYALSGGITISSNPPPTLQPNGCTVVLTTSTLPSSSQTLTASNIVTPAGATLPSTSGTFTYGALGWNVAVYKANFALSDTVAQSQGVVNTPLQQSWVKTEQAPYINYLISGYGSGPHFNPTRSVPGTTQGTETDNLVVTATGVLVVPSGGSYTYTFGCNSDDGFELAISGVSFSSITSGTSLNGDLRYDGGRTAADTLGVVTFPHAGDYPISLLWFQGVVGAECELFAAPGSYTAFSGTSSWQLVGDVADGGLPVGGVLSTAWCTTGVNPLVTNNTVPALSGSVSGINAAVTVRVAGAYYAATSGNGAWALPAGDIQPGLAAGTYNVAVFASNAAGQTAFNTGLNQLSIATAGPLAGVVAPVPDARTSALSSLSIQFNEPVSGFNLQNVQLTLNGLGTPLSGATLSSSDNQNWTLANLAGLTAAQGAYALTVTPAGWGIVDQYGNPMTAAGTNTWFLDTTPPTASLTTAPPTITSTSAAASTTSLTVTYADSISGINAATFSTANLAVTNGATVSAYSANGNAVTYTITAPSGTWGASTQGTYTVSLVGQQ